MRNQLRDAADRMSDDHILGLADTLHDALRSRREHRGRINDRLESRAFGEPQAGSR